MEVDHTNCTNWQCLEKVSTELCGQGASVKHVTHTINHTISHSTHTQHAQHRGDAFLLWQIPILSADILSVFVWLVLAKTVHIK